MLWDTMNAENVDITMDCTSFQMPRHAAALSSCGGGSAGVVGGTGSNSNNSSGNNNNHNNNNHNHNSRRLNMDLELNGSQSASAALHDMSIDELSFYDDENSTSLQRDYISSPAPLVGLLSPEGSPRRFQVVDRSMGCTANVNTVSGSASLLSSSSSAMAFTQFGRQQKLQTAAASNANNCTTTISSSLSVRTTASIAGTGTMMTGNKNFRTFHSLSSSGSMESASMDDDYMELLEMESLERLQDEDSQSRLNFPSDLNTLISGQIKSVTPRLIVSHNESGGDAALQTPELMRRPSVRRCLSMTENNYNNSQYHSMQPKTPELLREVQETATTPFSSRLMMSSATERNSPGSNSKLYHNQSNNNNSINNSYCFKRPDPPSITNSPVQSKRYRSAEEKENMHLFCKSSTTIASNGGAMAIGSGNSYAGGVPLRKCISMNDAEIMTALARSENKDEPDLIGDFSKPFALPLMDGRHRDLKSISSDTVARLLHGEFDEKVANFTIIDCRYPYEYDGGHIRGAKNLYTQEQIIDEFLTQQKTEQQNVRSRVSGLRRNIIIFHCEFSSERGPKLSRFLRNHDRARNTNAYPTLDYPEIYLLHNGYKEFYETHAELCEPVSYRPMLEPSYTEAYRHFRAKSKSWNGDVGCGTASRFKKSRSRLML